VLLALIIYCDKQYPTWIKATSDGHAGPFEQGSPYCRGPGRSSWLSSSIPI